MCFDVMTISKFLNTCSYLTQLIETLWSRQDPFQVWEAGCRFSAPPLQIRKPAFPSGQDTASLGSSPC